MIWTIGNLPGTHCAHSIPVCMDGHPGALRWIASAMTARRCSALKINIYMNPAIEAINSVALKIATYEKKFAFN